MNVVFFPVDDSPSCEFYVPMFRNSLSVNMEQTECSETSVNKIQMPGNHLKDRMQHSEQGENLKSRTS